MKHSDELYEKIKSQKLYPKPKWYFKFKAAFYWFLFISFTLLGAVSFSIILFAIQQADFDLIAHLSHSVSEFVLGIIPIVWLLSLIVFLIVAMIAVKKSKKGYKFSHTSIIAFSISFSILIGTLFFISGGAKYLENAFAIQFSNYKSIETLKISRWMNPENGYLSGVIIEINDESIELNDFNNKKWIIDFSNAKIKGNNNLEPGVKMKFIGETKGNNHFTATEIRHWGGKGPGSRRP